MLHARGGPIQRQRIAGSLWPESTDAQALTNLRRELHHLREGWPELDALVDAGSRTLAWRGDAHAIVDLVAFEAAADRGLAGDRAALQDAARLYQGDLLPDCAGEWIEPTANASVSGRRRSSRTWSGSSNTIAPSGMRSSMRSSCCGSIRWTKRPGAR